MSQEPQISIVTVVKNNASALKQTIESVISQTFKDYEYIIVDGGSTDNTPEIIKKYSGHIGIHISEPDNGIFDAMNKGARLANGKWINYLNAGDVFESPQILETVAELLNDDIDVAYGACRIIYKDIVSGVRLPRKLSMLWKGMPFSHQSVFCKTDLVQDYKFNTAYHLASAFDLTLRLHETNKHFVNLGFVIIQYCSGGHSDTKRLQVYYEYWKISRKHNGLCKCTLYFAARCSLEILKVPAKSILPQKLVRHIQLQKYSNGNRKKTSCRK